MQRSKTGRKSTAETNLFCILANEWPLCDVPSFGKKSCYFFEPTSTSTSVSMTMMVMARCRRMRWKRSQRWRNGFNCVYVWVCVWVCVEREKRETENMGASVCVCVCARACVCVCVLEIESRDSKSHWVFSASEMVGLFVTKMLEFVGCWINRRESFEHVIIAYL